MRFKKFITAVSLSLALTLTSCFATIPVSGSVIVNPDLVESPEYADKQYAEQIAAIEEVHGEPTAIGFADPYCWTKWRTYEDGFAYVYGVMMAEHWNPSWDKSLITDVYLEEGIGSIAGYAFVDMKLESIHLPDSLGTIGAETFKGSKIKSITLPNVVRINEKAFINTVIGEIFISDELEFLGYGAFMNSTIKEILIPKGVTAIEYDTFSGCEYLEKVELQGDVTWIGENAFTNCKVLTDVTIPKTVSYLGNGAFEGCTVLQSIEIPEKVTSLGDRTFANSGIESITIPDTVETIGQQAFYNCSNLLACKLPTALNEIENEVFYGCSSLKGTITIPDGITYIGENAFYNCNSLEGVEIPDSVVTIEDGAFYGCSSLPELSIPESTRIIGDEAFSGTTGIQTVTLSEGLNRIDKEAFAGCGAVSINVPKSVEIIEDSAFAGALAQTITLPENLQELGKEIFSHCSNLTKIEIPKNITVVRENAFAECVKLQAVTLPDGLEKIESGAFYNCISLSDIQAPDTVKEIGTEAFYNCDGLQVFDIPNQLQQMGDCAFMECDSLLDVVIPGTIKELTWRSFWGCDRLKSVVLENGVERVSEDEFRYCYSLESVVIPKSMKSIPDNLLEKTSEYQEDYLMTEFCLIGDGYLYKYNGTADKVVIPDTVKIIGTNAFYDKDMTEVVIPDSVTTIEENAFSRCDKLEKIQFGKNLTDVYRTAFTDTKYLQDKKLENPMVIEDYLLLDGTACVGEAVIPDGVTIIANEAFRDAKITSVQLSDTVKMVGYGAFWGCGYVEEIHIGTGVKEIGLYAFNGCQRVTEITVPSNVEKIGQGAFADCYDVTKVTVEPGVKIIEDSAFTNYNNLEEISLPDTLTDVGKGVFDAIRRAGTYNPVFFNGGCVLSCVWDATGDIVIPDYIKILASDVFTGTEELYSVTIPTTITHIEEDAFENCRSDMIIYAQEGSYGAKFAQEHDMIYIPWNETLNGTDRGEIVRYGSCKEDVNWVLYRSGLLYIYGTGAMDEFPDGMPWEGEMIQHVLIQDGITSVSANAWKDARFLVGVDIPSSITKIGENAFANLRKDVCLYSYAGTQAEQIAADNGYLFSDKTTAKVFDASVYGSIEMEGKCGDTAYYRIHGDGGVYIYGEGDMWDYEEETIDRSNGQVLYKMLSYKADNGLHYKPWTRLHENVDAEVGVEEVYIHKGITGVGDNAFVGCNRLYLPEGLQSIGDYALMNCILDELYLPKGLSYLGVNAFKNSQIKDVTVPASIVDLGNGAFVDSDIDKIAFEEGTTVIGNSVLGQCNLGEIILPNTVEIIENFAFAYSQFEEIQLPSGLKEIGYKAFINNNQLKGIVIPEGVEFIGSSAFLMCRDLESINFPSSLIQMGTQVAYYTKWLDNQTYTDGMMIVDNVLYHTQDAFGDWQIPEGVRVIAGGAFEQADITSVTIPDSVVGIGESAFGNCYLLEEVEIPSTVIAIDGRALDSTPWYEKKVQQEGLVIVNNILLGGRVDGEELIIPKGVEIVAAGAFVDEKSYNNIHVPASVRFIGSQAFRNMGDLDTITIYGNPVMKYDIFYQSTGKIIGKDGSYAQKYAKRYDMPFEVLEANSQYPTQNSGNHDTGDADGNGSLNLVDVQIALKAALKIISLTEVQKKAIDVIYDNQITLSDAQLILKVTLRFAEF